jgi:uncharacterized membrane protein
MNDDLPISLLIAAATGALMVLLPHISPRAYFFAITVPPGFHSSSAGKTSLRRYCVAVLCGVAIAVAAVFHWQQSPVQFLLAMAIPSAVGMAAFLFERRQGARVAPPAGTVREAELGAGDGHLPRWIVLVLPPFAFPLSAAVWLRAHWNEIPARFPVHWDIHNQADRWADKTQRAVYGPLMFAGGMMFIMVLLILAIFHGSRRGRQRTAIVKVMVVAIYFLALLFSAIGIMPATQLSPEVLVIAALLFPALLLVWIVKMLRDPTMPADATPDNCWYLGGIYVNKQDPAIFVQKRIGFGYAPNLGNLFSWLILGGLVLALVGLVLALPR